ncbi:methylenetetrahydrofolate reductase [NAD(P)H] [Paramaledivibacter caminithermalis]|uniref:Methylenetetrahydrofolate reductase n=1 Tax=Paramaledivibacter caminithermalis (strain DSM 15212 / CIP 107654 / DViRD3) TaxID=1121301 RepID=A0A1M6LJB8_PARC5|nr:methylenetetrahydrofolate reductase [NAD(P)H] [Paramaledivibacter caminithermalis]SHJ71291.1 5,10-methylenetetrahydrofolate reductase (NAD(P)) [Paramaledivibacter caminithermalis DSM 15212]
MLIRDKFKNKNPLISFEIFPPKKDYPVDTIYGTVDALNDLRPDFISVTYGAGGSTKDTTVDIASFIKNKYDLSALAHLTCLTSTKDEVEETLNSLKGKGVRNILALRGDYPEGAGADYIGPNHYKYAKDLIAHIKENDDFCIGAACYPEKHLECQSLDKDLLHLKEKVDAGVDFLITQLFFDNETFYSFKEKADKLGINVPIIAGILPVLNKNQVEKIISLTGCTLPKKFLRVLEKYEHKPEALREAGIAYAIAQIIDLLSWGVDGIHVYTMNRPKTTRRIIESITNIRGVLANEEAS